MNSSFPESLCIYCSCYEQEIYPWLHYHMRTPFWRFYACTEPGGVVVIDGKETHLLPGKFYFIPCYLSFSTYAEKPFSQFYIHFKLSEYLPVPRRIIIEDADGESAADIRRFIALRNREGAEQLRRFLALSVLSRAVLKLPEKYLLEGKTVDPRIQALILWMEAHLADELDNDFFARRLKMSRNGFCRLFRAETGESPKAYLQRKRIERACELLHDKNKSIDEIAAETGFCDRYHFSKVFARILAMPPARFRRFAVGGGGRYFG
ncbi:MAG: helix-turn-helix domain-containing protein [Victivallaceae bacterium]|nr:helix-turn-helix domain-containing protein [Victivallaceae bacterium]